MNQNRAIFPASFVFLACSPNAQSAFQSKVNQKQMPTRHNIYESKVLIYASTFRLNAGKTN